MSLYNVHGIRWHRRICKHGNRYHCTMCMTLHLRDDDCQGSHLIPHPNVTVIRQHAILQKRMIFYLKRGGIAKLFYSFYGNAESDIENIWQKTMLSCFVINTGCIDRLKPEAISEEDVVASSSTTSHGRYMFETMHYRLRPIKQGQLKFATFYQRPNISDRFFNFASHFMFFRAWN